MINIFMGYIYKITNNIDNRTISKNINGKTRTGGGFIWKKIED